MDGLQPFGLLEKIRVYHHEIIEVAVTVKVLILGLTQQDGGMEIGSVECDEFVQSVALDLKAKDGA